MAVVVRSRLPLSVCPDCKSEHLGPPCGCESAAERYRTVQLSTDWMPAKQRSRELGHTEYYDDQSLSALFDDGLTGAERHDELMDESQGVGFATAAEVNESPELAVQHYLEDSTEIIGES